MEFEELMVVTILVMSACVAVVLANRTRSPKYKIQVPAPSTEGWSDLKREDDDGYFWPKLYSSEYLACLELECMREHRYTGRVVPEDTPEDECLYEGRS